MTQFSTPISDHRNEIIDVPGATDDQIRELLAFHNKAWGASRTPAHWRWEYQDFLPEKAVVAVARKDGRIIGTQCAMPVPMKVEGRVVLSGKSENTLLLPEFRGLGIMEDLYEFMVEECKVRGLRFLWGFTDAERAFRRFGFFVHPVVEIWSRPGFDLATGLVSRWREPRAISRRVLSMGKAGVDFFRTLPRFLSNDSGLGAESIPVSQLVAGESGERGGILHRGPASVVGQELSDGFLEWRVSRHPFLQYTARKIHDAHGEAGFSLVSLHQKKAALSYWEGTDEGNLKGLLVNFVQMSQFKNAQLTVLTNSGRDDHPMRRDLLLRQGFRPTHCTNLVIRDLSEILTGTLLEPTGWLLNGLWTEGYAL